MLNPNIGGHGVSQTATAGAASSGSQPQSATLSASAFPVLLTDSQAAACLGVSVRTFHNLRSEPWLPKPVVLGPRLLRWPRTELEQAVLTMPRQAQPSSEPAQLRRAKIDAMKARGQAPGATSQAGA